MSQLGPGIGARAWGEAEALLRQTTAALATALHWARPDGPQAATELLGCLTALDDAAVMLDHEYSVEADFPHLAGLETVALAEREHDGTPTALPPVPDSAYPTGAVTLPADPAHSCEDPARPARDTTCPACVAIERRIIAAVGSLDEREAAEALRWLADVLDPPTLSHPANGHRRG